MSIVRKPAILTGEPVSAERMGIVAPRFPDLDQVAAPLREILHSGALTNNGRHVQAFEHALAERFGLPYALTVSNATLGLIVALKGLNLSGEVILPSFTYCATAHALHWAGLSPVFADILPDTFTLDPAAVLAAITPRTAAILPVHIYGHPCEIDELAEVARKHGLAVLYDAAHAFGSRYRNQPVGTFGDAEVFSFHATKCFPVGEGGCIMTSDRRLAEYVTLARRFGDPGDEDTLFPGLNAKMQEFNAILGLEALHVVDQHIDQRLRYASCLMERLGRLPGLSFQAIRPYAFSNRQNFAILVDDAGFGLSRDQLFTALGAENISPRKYFYPPLHHHKAYEAHRHVILPVTERVSNQVLCLPFYSEMTEATLDRLCLAIERIHAHAPLVRAQLA